VTTSINRPPDGLRVILRIAGRRNTTLLFAW